MKFTIEISWNTVDNIIGLALLISSFVVLLEFGLKWLPLMVYYIFSYPVGLHMALGNIKFINGKRMKRYRYWKHVRELWRESAWREEPYEPEPLLKRISETIHKWGNPLKVTRG